jgi:hypothetical protein
MSNSFRIIPPVTPENMSAVDAFSLSWSEGGTCAAVGTTKRPHAQGYQRALLQCSDLTGVRSARLSLFLLQKQRRPSAQGAICTFLMRSRLAAIVASSSGLLMFGRTYAFTVALLAREWSAFDTSVGGMSFCPPMTGRALVAAVTGLTARSISACGVLF